MSTASKKKVTRNWARPTQISRHLYCSVCADVFRDPLRLHCTHTFCRECIDEWKKSNTSCPECRQVINSDLITDDRLASRIINDLEVSCIHKLCDWRDSLESLEKHVKTCSFEKSVPKWVKELKSDNYIKLEKSQSETIYGTDNDALYEKLNEEMPKGNLTERLLKKDTKVLKTLKTIVTTNDDQKPAGKKKQPKKSKSMRDIESVFDINISEDEDFAKADGAADSMTESTRNTASKMGSGTKLGDLMAVLDEEEELLDDVNEKTQSSLLDRMNSNSNLTSQNKELDQSSELLSNPTEANEQDFAQKLKQQNKGRRTKLEAPATKRSRVIKA